MEKCFFNITEKFLLTENWQYSQTRCFSFTITLRWVLTKGLRAVRINTTYPTPHNTFRYFYSSRNQILNTYFYYNSKPVIIKFLNPISLCKTKNKTKDKKQKQPITTKTRGINVAVASYPFSLCSCLKPICPASSFAFFCFWLLLLFPFYAVVKSICLSECGHNCYTGTRVRIFLMLNFIQGCW